MERDILVSLKALIIVEVSEPVIKLDNRKKILCSSHIKKMGINPNKF